MFAARALYNPAGTLYQDRRLRPFRARHGACREHRPGPDERQAALLRWPLLLRRDDVLPGRRLWIRPWRAVTTFDATLRPSDHQDVLDAHDAKQPSMADRARRRRQYFDRPRRISTPCRARTPSASLRGRCSRRIASDAPPRRNGADGWELSCPPEIEAGTYDAVGRTTAPYDSLPNFPVPAHLVGADPAAPGGTWIGQREEAFAGKLPKPGTQNDRLRPPHAFKNRMLAPRSSGRCSTDAVKPPHTSRLGRRRCYSGT